MEIEVLTAIPASGKTKAIIEHIIESGEKAIIASISRQLSKQSYDFYINAGGEKAILIDSDNKYGSKSVNEAIIDTKNYNVMFITHSALINLTDFSHFGDVCLYIDEVPELVTFNKYNFGHNLNSVLEYCLPVKDGLSDLVLRNDCTRQIEEMAIQGINQQDDICKSLVPLYKALLQKIPIKINKTDKTATCYFINDSSSQDWAGFKKITIASANLKDTFTGKVLKYFNGWEFIESPLKKRLLFTEYSNTSRITINVLTDTNWSKHKADKEINGISNYTRIKNIISDILGNEPFIYTRNSYRARFSKGLEVPYNPHGINSYTSYKNVVVLFSFNPNPWQIPVLKELACSVGLDEDELVESYIVSKYLEPAFQLCARSNIRSNKSNAKINLFVPDQKLADYIKLNYFKNAEIKHNYMVEEPKIKQVRNRKSYQKQYNMTDKEKYRYMYLLRKLGRKLDINNEDDQKLVKDWIEDQRK